ncbi:hypothetical protein MMC17_007045 [Xylographa soralifera]|nr:hypothetical protein [Xylographa soralifera]
MRSTDVGKRLLPSLIDETAKSEPDAVYAEYPVSSTDLTAGLRTVTYAQLANGINGVALWLKREIGMGENHETLAYIGPNDLRYYIVIVGAVKAGYKILLTSPRNSLLAHTNLLESLDCHTLLMTNPPLPSVNVIITAREMHQLCIPDLEELLTGHYAHFPYTKKFEEAKDDPLVCLHTSGSTGLPKPRILSHGWCAAFEMLCKSSAEDGHTSTHETYHSGRFFTVMPPFHAAGVVMSLFTAAFTRMTIIMPSPNPLSVDGIMETLEIAKADTVLLPPSIIEDISKQPALLTKLSNVKRVMYAGGALPKSAGDAVASKVTLWTIFGNTEIGYLPLLVVDGDDWAYIHPNSKTSSAEFRHKTDDLFELVLVKRSKLIDYLPIFQLFPELEEYHTSDLFSPHPNRPGLWTHRGRADDIILFLNGEKTNPITMEQHIQSHPEVRNALVIGEGRFEAALLIELTEDVQLSVERKAKIIESLWPTVNQANRDCPAHARVSKSHILFVDPTKPTAKAWKGTVLRKATLDLYSKEIDNLYTDADISVNMDFTDKPIHIDLNDVKSVRSCVHQIICFVTSWDHLVEDDDLFSKGFDSLQVIQTVRYLKAGLTSVGVNVKEVAPSTIYTNPSISKLATAIMVLSRQVDARSGMGENLRVTAMTEMLDKYSNSLANAKATFRQPRTDHKTHEVLLTGSTGMLGSYILEALIASPAISKVYCLNRSEKAEERQFTINNARGLTTDFDSNHIVFLTANYSKLQLGLSEEQYASMLSKISLVIHNAWLVDFNLPLSPYDSHIAGVRNLIKFSLASSRLAKLLFISSVSSVSNYPDSLVPEQIIISPTAPSPMGYGMSKHIAERLLAHAATTLGLPATIARVGQIAGPVHFHGGVWPRAEWLPRLVISSKHLGVVPDSLGGMDTVDWIPVDDLSMILVELALHVERPAVAVPEAVVYHAVNPRLTTWAALVPAVLAALGEGVKTVSLDEWIELLRERAGAEMIEEEVARSPALKLLAFYEGLRAGTGAVRYARLETRKAEDVSKGLRELEAVSGGWMKAWVKGWMSSEQSCVGGM